MSVPVTHCTSAAFADYILVNPSDDYASIFTATQEKMYMSKLLIELLLAEPNSDYEDLVNKIEVKCTLHS